jgi:16S rRNA (guanine966-N2)-methyltransferase
MQHSKRKKAGSSMQNNLSKGVVRIIGGQMRGRKLHFSTVAGLRPTLDRIRETLFNWLARDINNAQCLDLFAGSGALGFEAASRGAAQVVMVEASAKVIVDLKRNCKLLNVDNIKLVNLEAAKFLETSNQKFDLVFLDPPFGKDMLAKTLELLQPKLAPNALVYIEQESSDSPFIPDKHWQQLKFKQTASFSYALYQLLMPENS